MRPPLIRAGAGPLEAYALAHNQRLQAEANVTRVVLTVGAEPLTPDRIYGLGDVDLLRGIPCVGTRGGLGGAIPGTRP